MSHCFMLNMLQLDVTHALGNTQSLHNMVQLFESIKTAVEI